MLVAWHFIYFLMVLYLEAVEADRWSGFLSSYSLKVILFVPNENILWRAKIKLDIWNVECVNDYFMFVQVFGSS